MANDYYENSTTITPFSKAKSSDVDGDFNDIEAGFTKLPAPHASAPTTKGFSEAYVNVAGTDETHATNIKQIRDGAFFVGADNSSAANAFSITLTPTAGALTTGMIVMFKIPAGLSNTGACTLDVDSLGVKSIKSTDGGDPAANEIYAGSYSWFQYDGTYWQLIFPSMSSLSAPSVTIPAASGAYKALTVNNAGTAYTLDYPRVVPPSGVENEGNIIGFTMSNGTDADHDIDIATGSCFDSAGVNPLISGTVVTKQIDADWVAGSDAGGLLDYSVAPVAANTIYDLYLLRKDSNGTVDAGFLSNSRSIGPYLPSGYTSVRWIGYVYTDASANIVPFSQVVDWVTFVSAQSVATGLNSATYSTVDIGEVIPSGRVSEIVPRVGFDTALGDAFLSVSGTDFDIYQESATAEIASMPMPNSGTTIYYKQTGGTDMTISIKSVKLRR